MSFGPSLPELSPGLVRWACSSVELPMWALVWLACLVFWLAYVVGHFLPLSILAENRIVASGKGALYLHLFGDSARHEAVGYLRLGEGLARLGGQLSSKMR